MAVTLHIDIKFMYGAGQTMLQHKIQGVCEAYLFRAKRYPEKKNLKMSAFLLAQIILQHTNLYYLYMSQTLNIHEF